MTGVDGRRGELLRLVAAVERESEHPLAEAIVARRAERGARGAAAPTASRASPGTGRWATVDGPSSRSATHGSWSARASALGGLAAAATRLAGEGRTVVHVAIDGRAAGLLAIADAPRGTRRRRRSPRCSELGVAPVMLTGDNRATAERVAAELGVEEVHRRGAAGRQGGQGRRAPGAGPQGGDGRRRRQRRPALAQADVGIAIGAGTDVAIETADVVLMRSDPLDVATAIAIGRGTVRKMRQNLGWAIGYNSLALPIAAGVFEPWGLTLRPEIAAITMSGSSIIVALNALALKRLRLPALELPPGPTRSVRPRARCRRAPPSPSGSISPTGREWCDRGHRSAARACNGGRVMTNR